MFILQLIWGLPQTILGVCLYGLLYKQVTSCSVYKGIIIVRTENFNGVSLGCYIFLNEKYGIKTLKHEFGHSLQSAIFGWLYLLVIGLPSLINYLLAKYNVGDYRKNYYKKYPEKWADKLGGVKRS